MFLFSLIISTHLAVALSRPQESVAAAGQSGSTPIAIISQNEEINPDGSFKFSYETANGIKVDETGYLRDDPSSTDKIQVIEGSVSYTDNDGKVISLRYVADENGFQPEGDHLPTPPSLPSGEAQAKTLSQQPSASVPVQKAAAAPVPKIAVAPIAAIASEQPAVVTSPAIVPTSESETQTTAL
ncbi:endocuticle structural glycoprotein SgAbd-4-like [Anoplophora glabripennis]|uniref:endocuticle structural glycoprotein SgAbd-4-like n=1 Tax=Anoplophora glabripennis TaxID=217634 RepID=UPI000874E81D|nr:endocuticle structural glycoprotein SgAbd-4-like [Anoplophora glabripennis]